MDTQSVIKALEVLSTILNDPAPTRRKQIDKIIAKLKDPSINGIQIGQLKRELSKDILFHPKCLGEIIVPGFTSEEWGDYLSGLAEICQNDL